MKRIAAWVLALVMMLGGSVALAEDIDFSGKTVQELLNIIDAARTELALQLPPVSDGETLYEDDNLVMTLNGEPAIEYGNLVLPVIIVNKTDRNLLISFENSSCNGWDVLAGSVSVSASKKARADIELYCVDEDADLADVSELEDVTCFIRYFDDDDWEWYYECEDSLVWTFAP